MYCLVKKLNTDVCRVINEYANDKYIKIHKNKQILVAKDKIKTSYCDGHSGVYLVHDLIFSKRPQGLS